MILRILRSGHCAADRSESRDSPSELSGPAMPICLQQLEEAQHVFWKLAWRVSDVALLESPSSADMRRPFQNCRLSSVARDPCDELRDGLLVPQNVRQVPTQP